VGSIPVDYTSFNQCLGDTWWPLIGPRVAIPFATNKLRVICQLVHMTTNHTYHVSYDPATCHTTLPRQHPYGLYGLYNHHTFFLLVCRFEQNATSLSSDVCLNPNELRWVHDDKAYSPIQFEAIPSTLNFEKNLIPWITPPHWKDFGPPKDYF
jgi:hypothetical protein